MIQKHGNMKNLDLSGKNKIYTKHLQILMVEVYKCLNNISPPFTWEYFNRKNSPYNLRNIQLIELSKRKTKTYGLNTALFKCVLFYNKLTKQIILTKHIQK